MATSAATDTAPGMGTLINALTAETATAPALPTLVVVPRPHAFARLLAASSVALIAVLAGLMLYLVHAVSGLLGGIVAHERALAAPVVAALPAGDRLLDDAAFAACLGELPGEATRLHLARARAFAANGRFAEAAASYAKARQLAINGLPAADRVAEAEALVEGGREGDALRELLSLDYAAMDAAVRAQAVALLGRCHLATRAARRAAGEPAGARLP